MSTCSLLSDSSPATCVHLVWFKRKLLCRPLLQCATVGALSLCLQSDNSFLGDTRLEIVATARVWALWFPRLPLLAFFALTEEPLPIHWTSSVEWPKMITLGLGRPWTVCVELTDFTSSTQSLSSFPASTARCPCHLSAASACTFSPITWGNHWFTDLWNVWHKIRN